MVDPIALLALAEARKGGGGSGGDGAVQSTVVSTIWAGTQAEYDALAAKQADTLYLITSGGST